MQIVIELSDETYDKVINPNNWYDPNSAIEDIVKAIKDGTTLPKKHGDLIDRKDLIENGIRKGFCDWYDEIKKADAIIEADKEHKHE
jgi:hypothetical protein